MYIQKSVGGNARGVDWRGESCKEALSWDEADEFIGGN